MATSSSMAIAGGSAGVDDTSSSEIHATKVSASHVLTINGYSHSKSLVAPGEHISSSFTAAGHRWSFLYYPRGHDLEDAEYVSLFLSCTSDTDVKARSTLCLLDKDGKLVYTCKCRSYLPTSSSLHLQGFSSKRKDLERTHVRDDRFRILCEISVLKLVQKEDASAAAAVVPKFVDVPPSDIFKQLGDLLSSGDGTDVMFEVDGESFGAHRSILAARSPVFRAEMFSPMKEGTATCVWIEDMEPRVFKALLHFVYNDVLPEINEGEETMVMAQHLLVAVDRYYLERMKMICEEKLCGYVYTSNVGTMLALADQHGCRGLQKACLNFLMSGGNRLAAIMTGGMQQVLSSCPSVKELLLKSCSSKSIS